MQINAEGAKEAGEIGYVSRYLITTTMPHSCINTAVYERADRNVRILMTDIFSVGLPYGALPRLILCWCNTQFLIKKNRTIVLGRSFNEFLKELGFKSPSGGVRGSITSVKPQLIKLFGCHIAYERNGEENYQTMNFDISASKNIPWEPVSPNQWQSRSPVIELSRDYCEKALYKPVPVDMRALRALRRSPLAMDLYTFITYRMVTVKKKTYIPLRDLQIAFGSSYGTNKAGASNFQSNLKKALYKVKTVYPCADVELISGRLVLFPSDTSVRCE